MNEELAREIDKATLERLAANHLAEIGNYYPDYPEALAKTIKLIEVCERRAVAEAQAELKEKLAAARLEEAKWWENIVNHPDFSMNKNKCVERIAELEKQKAEKGS